MVSTKSQIGNLPACSRRSGILCLHMEFLKTGYYPCEDIITGDKCPENKKLV